MKNTMNEMVMNEKELDMVNGGGWGYHNYRNEDEYRAAGISTDWTYLPVRDGFYFHGERIDKDTAAKIVFFVRATNPVPGKFSKGDALNYAVAHPNEFKHDMNAANGNLD